MVNSPNPSASVRHWLHQQGNCATAAVHFRVVPTPQRNNQCSKPETLDRWTHQHLAKANMWTAIEIAIPKKQGSWAELGVIWCHIEPIPWCFVELLRCVLWFSLLRLRRCVVCAIEVLTVSRCFKTNKHHYKTVPNLEHKAWSLIRNKIITKSRKPMFLICFRNSFRWEDEGLLAPRSASWKWLQHVNIYITFHFVPPSKRFQAPII